MLSSLLKRKPKRILSAFSVAFLSFCLAQTNDRGPTSCAETPLVQSGETIVFLGDSITYYGNSRPLGYIHLVMKGLEAVGVKATAIPAGAGGHKSNQMMACGVLSAMGVDAKRDVRVRQAWEEYRKSVIADRSSSRVIRKDGDR